MFYLTKVASRPEHTFDPDSLEAIPSLTRVLFDPARGVFFYSKGKKLKNWGFLGEIFQIQTQTKDS